MTDYAARLAELMERETKALARVTTAATALARKRERNDTTRQRLSAEEAELDAALVAAQGAYAAAAGPERAALVLGISATAARGLAKTHETTHVAADGQLVGDQHREYAS